MGASNVPRVVFFGMDSQFSTRPLLALLETGVDVCAVVKPMGGTALRRTNVATRIPSLMTRIKERCQDLWTGGAHRVGMPGSRDATVPEDPFTVGDAARIPCILVGDASGTRSLGQLQRMRADVYCIAFFNQLLRPGCLALPRLGAINLHPSLLPAYRGPAPLFWIFKDALRQTGITLHMLTPGEDDGDVLAQQTVELPDGIRGPELLGNLARMGASLMAKGVWDLFHGVAQRQGQDQAKAFRKPRPSTEDLRIDFTRSARDVFNFVRGVSQWMPLYAQVGMDRLPVRDAQAFEPGTRIPGEFSLSGDVLMAQCPDGTVILNLFR